jgi:hypothetical protein
MVSTLAIRGPGKRGTAEMLGICSLLGGCICLSIWISPGVYIRAQLVGACNGSGGGKGVVEDPRGFNKKTDRPDQ